MPPAKSNSPLPATHLALLRGINVGGRNMLPMPALAALFEKAGCDCVRTYIQSGNVLFRAKPGSEAALERKLPALIARSHGFEPRIIIRPVSDLPRVIADNPYPKAAATPKLLHAGFLAAAPSKNRAALLDPARSPGDTFALRGQTVYVLYGNSFAKTRLTYTWFESVLQTPCTFRNWSTVLKLAELAAVS